MFWEGWLLVMGLVLVFHRPRAGSCGHREGLKMKDGDGSQEGAFGRSQVPGPRSQVRATLCLKPW